MSESFITINNNKVELPNGTFTARNAQYILLSGHILHSIKTCEQTQERILSINEEDRKNIVFDLRNLEGWLFSAVNVMGELISAADSDEFEDHTLNNAGYLISALTELLQSVQHTRKEVISCQVEVQEVKQ
jgi:hypothetical protein